jgi:hypothetical protein
MELKTLTLNGKTYDSFPFILTDADKQEIAERAAEMVGVPEGGGGGTARWALLHTLELTEAAQKIFVEFEAHKHIMITFDNLHQNNDDSKTVDFHLTPNSNGYNGNAGFSMKSCVWGSVYNCFGTLDIEVIGDMVNGSYRVKHGSSGSYTDHQVRKASYVGETIHSFNAYLPGVAFAPGLIVKVYGEG